MILALLGLALWLAGALAARADAVLELFQMTWPQITAKMPELAEAGYTSLWLPPPAKASSSSSVGYDPFDPFDLGSTNQNGSFATRYGTEAQLLQMVQTAHRFGIRIYFDNIMNHRSAVVPGYNATTPTNYYPGMLPQDFHLYTTTANGGQYANWNDISDWCNVQDILYNPLLGLVDIANEPGSTNGNFGHSLYSTIPKLSFVRHPNNPQYYLNTNGPSLGGPWYPFYTTNGAPVADDVNSYLIRAVMWTLFTTKCDGFRLDAVKQVPAGFFGANSANPQTDDPTFSGYTGGIQAMFDYTHGYGSNVLGNGYLETDGNRNSCFDTEAVRNDAMIFGEHVNAPPNFQDYLNAGMRLMNYPLFGEMNTVLSGDAGWNNGSGMDGRDYNPPEECCTESGTQNCYPTYSPAYSLMFAQNQDSGACCPVHREMQDAYYFMHEGLPMIYSDNWNWAGPVNSAFPIVAEADYLGEFGNNQMPEIVYLHGQVARGGTRSRWHDQYIVAWERYDYRDVNNVNGAAYTNDLVTTMLFVMNDNFGNPGDTLFDDGIEKTSDGYYECYEGNGTPSEHCGLCVAFPPGTVLTQMASTSTGANRACPQLLVHNATTNYSAAQSSANAAAATNRLIYVNTAPPAGGGAVELLVPSGGWVIYAVQWPEPSRANAWTNAITLRQNGLPAPHALAYRMDGTNGDPNFNPSYPFLMRGGVDPYGNVITGTKVTNLTYAIDIPVVTNANFDIVVRSDASASNTLVKLDGGVDLNSQMGLGPTNGADLRDNRPGYASDIYLGYEQTAFNYRNGPEKFAARNIASNNIVSLGAETYYYTVGASNNLVVPGAGYGENITNDTANWVFHDPTNVVTSLSTNPPTQLFPLYPGTNASVEVWVKVGYQFQINTCFVYYTTDGSNPEGAFGVGKGTTQVVQGHWVNHDSSQENIDWWECVIPGQAGGIQVRYKVALFNGGSVNAGQNIAPISYAEASGSKLFGLNEAVITNFNPNTALIWLHNDLNPANTTTGLQSGFHILRARTFLPRTNSAGVYNTFAQTFYYDGGLPGGVIVFPAANGSSLNGASYQFVVRADSTVTSVTFNIQDSNSGNDDIVTGQANGNGNDTNGNPIFVSAAAVTPDTTLSQEYPQYPQEFRFNYVNIPSSGTATVNIRLNEFATSLYTNRFTLLSRNVNTLAPTNFLYFSSPSSNNTVLLANSNTVYLLQACYTPTMDTNQPQWFNLYINSVLQPYSSYILRPNGSCPGMHSIYYNWKNIPPGNNTLTITFTNAATSGGEVLSDTINVIVPEPFALSGSGLLNSPPLLVWNSTAGLSYQVLYTTNLSLPFQPLGSPVQASGPATFFPDPSSNAPQKFYEVEVVP